MNQELTCFEVRVSVPDGVFPTGLLHQAPSFPSLLPVLLLFPPQPVDGHLEEGASLTPLLTEVAVQFRAGRVRRVVPGEDVFIVKAKRTCCLGCFFTAVEERLFDRVLLYCCRLPFKLYMGSKISYTVCVVRVCLFPDIKLL